MPTHLEYAYTSRVCLHIWNMPTHLEYAYTSGICLHIWNMPTHLEYVYTSGICLHMNAEVLFSSVIPQLLLENIEFDKLWYGGLFIHISMVNFDGSGASWPCTLDEDLTTC
jgi:hypothetical protein